MSRTATITTDHGSAERAAMVAAALAPDNTDEMTTTTDGRQVTTTIERETTGGLQATVDDYVVNVRIADELTDTTQS
jgi:hypothetical protein